MLHIFLFILKLIGWILLVILGLLILAVIAALFTPLRYQVETSCKGKLSTLEAGINFRILFRLISGRIQYRDGNLDWNIRAAWIRMGSQTDAEDMEETVEEETEKKIEAIENTRDSIEPSKNVEKKEDGSEKPGNAERKEGDLEKPDDAEKKEDGSEKPEDDSEEKKNAVEKADSQENESSKENLDVSEELLENPSDSITESKSADRKTGKKEKRTKETTDEEKERESLTDKIAAIFEKIKYTFDRICAKIKMLLEKAENVKAFLTDDVHQSAFLKCLTELKKMVIRLRPKQIMGKVHFGFEDPSWTGRVLAGVSMFYPYWGEHVCCYPDFENKVLDGELSVEGSLRLLPAAVLAWNLLWDKHVRRTVMDAKRFIFK